MENFQMQIDFNLMEGICKMLEVIDKSDKARKFAYVVLFLGFILGTYWLAPNFLKAVADFILTMKNS